MPHTQYPWIRIWRTSAVQHTPSTCPGYIKSYAFIRLPKESISQFSLIGRIIKGNRRTLSLKNWRKIEEKLHSNFWFFYSRVEGTDKRVSLHTGSTSYLPLEPFLSLKVYLVGIILVCQHIIWAHVWPPIIWTHAFILCENEHMYDLLYLSVLVVCLMCLSLKCRVNGDISNVEGVKVLNNIIWNTSRISLNSFN